VSEGHALHSNMINSSYVHTNQLKGAIMSHRWVMVGAPCKAK